MSDKSVTHVIRRFYEQHQFPGNRPVDQDGLILMRRFGLLMDVLTKENGRIRIRVLDAGCGTGNTSISLASRFPEARFIGIDSSTASLEKARASAHALGLKNLRFRRWNLMRPLPGRGMFNIVLCLGVLHHTADGKLVIRNLYRALARGGNLFLWIYGKHGRYRHSLNMQLLDMLLSGSLSPDETMELTRQFIYRSADGTVMKDLIGNLTVGALEQRAFDDPVWIADQFLNPHEELLEMKELLRVIRGAGFILEHAVGMDDSAASRLGSPELQERFARLSQEHRLIALDLLLKPKRYFVVLRRPTSSVKA